ncbi:SDR family NAD(P)-dependent oxidoreductase [Methylobacterium oxalidis]|uniref:SDR family NAD(P)-dependent oxidoreductase n=1 Tax=Methylobacterium oxalidis TaxID=944322 RepID=UPI003316480F
MPSTGRPLALVTGASSGIGADLARVLAGRGHDLLIVARSTDRLQNLARELAGRGAQVHIETEDLAASGAAGRLVERVRSAGHQVDVLVNNAGFGLAGPFHHSSPAELTGMIGVNITALTELSRAFLPGMIERRRGGILNVASVAAFQPGPFMAVYYASKAYVLSFSEALWEECRGTGVTVTALCPGPVETGFAERAAMTSTRLFESRLMPKMPSARVAELGVAGFQRGQRVVIPGVASNLIANGSRLTPRRLVLLLTRYLQTSGSPKSL